MSYNFGTISIQPVTSGNTVTGLQGSYTSPNGQYYDYGSFTFATLSGSVTYTDTVNHTTSGPYFFHL